MHVQVVSAPSKLLLMIWISYILMIVGGLTYVYITLKGAKEGFSRKSNSAEPYLSKKEIRVANISSLLIVLGGCLLILEAYL